MKNKGILKKILRTVTAVAMAVGVGSASRIQVSAEDTPTSATAKSNDSTTATVNVGNGAGTITIHLPTAYTGTGTAQNFNYKVYKVFNATVDTTVSGGTNPTAYTYRLEDGENDVPSINGTGNKFIKDDAGNVYYGKEYDTQENDSVKVTINGATKYIVSKIGKLTSDEAQEVNTAMKSYLHLDGNGTAATPVANVNVANNFSTLEITGLGYGYYYITTTAGSAVALTSTNPDAVIESKNDVPSVDKKITGVDDGTAANSKGSVTDDGKNAIAELGATVHYQSTIDVKKGAENYLFKDKMEDGLALNTGSIKVQSQVGTNDAVDVPSENNYTINTNGDSTFTFSVNFNNRYITTLENQVTDDTPVKIIVSYTANVTAEALKENTINPLDNSATISYGDNSSHSSDPSVTHVYTARFKVTKHIDNNGTVGDPLANATFVLKNSSGNYYKYTAASGSNPAKVSWVSTEEEATKLTSDTNGNVVSVSPALNEFVGLTNGTYTLHETKAPDGYNKAEDSDFTISVANANDAFTVKNLYQTKDVLDRPGKELPSTGGIGTTIFYVAGGILIIGAAVLLIARRKRSA